MKKYLNKYLKSNFFISLTTLVSGQVIAQLITLLTTPIVSRIYLKSDFGLFALITSSATIISAVFQLGLTSGIVVANDDNEAKKLFSSSIIIQIIMIFIFFILGLLIFELISYELPFSNIVFISIILLYTFLLTFNHMLRVYMNRMKFDRAIFWNSLIASLSTLFITIPLGLLGVGFIGLLVAGMISSLVGIMQMIYKSNPIIKINYVDIKNILNKYKLFIFHQFPSNIIDTFTLQFPNQLFSSTFGNDALGSYSMSNNVLNIPSKLVATPINNLYFRTAVEYVKKDNDLPKFTYNLIIKISLISFIPLITLMSLGEFIFSFVLGEQWFDAGKISAILAIPTLLSFCSMSVGYCRIALGKQKFNFFISIIHLIVVMLSILIGIYLYNNIISAIIAYAIGNTIYNIIDMSSNFIVLKKYLFKYLSFIIIYVCLSLLIAFLIRRYII